MNRGRGVRKRKGILSVVRGASTPVDSRSCLQRGKPTAPLGTKPGVLIDVTIILKRIVMPRNVIKK